MTDEQFNGLLNYLSQNKEKIFGSLMNEREEMNREHNCKVAELDEELARKDRLIRELDEIIEERARLIREFED